MKILVACEESQAIQPYQYGHPYSKRDPKIRSKTFPGIAEAMADQWGCLHD